MLEQKVGNGKSSQVYLGSDGKGHFKVFFFFFFFLNSYNFKASQKITN